MATLRFGNDSGVTFTGYLRATVDSALPFPNGGAANGYFVLGNQCGLDTWCIDVYAGISPNGDRRTINTNTADPFPWGLGSHAPFSSVVPTIGGTPMTFMGVTANGAAWDGHWRLRVGPMLLVELFVHWYPDDRQFAYVEVVVASSNPAVTDVIGTIPANFTLAFDGATVILAGLADNAPLMQQGDWLADGQCRILTGVLHFPQFGGSNAMCRALAEGKVTLVGIDKLHHGGNPILPPGFDASFWTAQLLPLTIVHLHDWATFAFGLWTGGITNALDPNVQSGDTGAQGSQKMIAGPVIADCGAAGPFYFAGLAQKWPCNHCEADGRLLDPPPEHPNLAMNHGRVNRQIGGPWTDTLGKPFEPSPGDRHGFQGPEWEHDFDWTLWAAKRIKGTAALEWLVSARARLTLFSEPSMRGIFFLPPARGVGWFFFKCVEIYRNLTDRALADQVKQLAVDVLDGLFLPLHGGIQPFPQGWWSWTSQGQPFERSICWQVAVQCLGLRWAGDAFDHQGARDLSSFMADEIISRVWFHDGTRWTSRDEIRLDGEPFPGNPHGTYDFFAQPFAIAAKLLADPEHEPANTIWAQLVVEASADPNLNGWNDTAWLGSPGVLASAPAPIVGTASVSVAVSVTSTNALVITGALSDSDKASKVGVTAASTATLRIAGTGAGTIDVSVAATGSETPHTHGVASVGVEVSAAATGVLPIKAVASTSVEASVVAVGAGLLGLTGTATVNVGVTATSAGKLRVAAAASPAISVSVVSDGRVGGLPSLPPVNGVLSRTIEVSASASATGRVKPPPTPPPGRGRPRRSRWWQAEPIDNLLAWLMRRR